MMAATEEPVSTEEPQARGIVDDVINAVSDAVDESKDVANDITSSTVPSMLGRIARTAITRSRSARSARGSASSRCWCIAQGIAT